MNDVHQAIRQGDLAVLVACLKRGDDPDSCNEFGESALYEAILHTDDSDLRLEFVHALIGAGADVKQRHAGGGGPLIAAVIQYDSRVLKLLLEHGADPNKEHDQGEPLFDWAEFHYRNDEYRLDLPVEPSDSDSASTDSWLAFLSGFASEQGRSRLECLYLLRQYGAIGWRERERTSHQESVSEVRPAPPDA